MKKAMEQAIWIVVSMVIGLACALVLILLLSGTSESTEDSIFPLIKELGNNLKSMLLGG